MKGGVLVKLKKHKNEAALILQFGCVEQCGEEIIFDHVTGGAPPQCTDANGFFKGYYVSTK
jgi:hypothetical protein